MSLDVYLEVDTPHRQEGHSGIFIREGGTTKEITREEWDKRHPGREPVVAPVPEETCTVFHGNITHNLSGMADVAGLYKVCWCPEDLGITKAAQLIPHLKEGLVRLVVDPDRFRKLNPDNGWGTYEGFLRFVTVYLVACEKYPESTVRIWR